jgi:hypothetical protein
VHERDRYLIAGCKIALLQLMDQHGFVDGFYIPDRNLCVLARDLFSLGLKRALVLEILLV